jgi:lipoate-protein ligase B
LGRVPYAIALDIQNQWVERILNTSEMAILGLEHPSVITLGRRAKPEEEIKIKMDSLEDLNIQYYKVDRGGHATLHSPGQLVIYPILKLSSYGLSVRPYLCALQKATISFFAQYGIKTFAKEDSPGIYTEKGKIAFFGIRVKRGIAFHGLSINVTNEMDDFSLIKSCGTNFEKFDQMSLYGVSDSLDQLYCSWTDLFLQTLPK